MLVLVLVLVVVVVMVIVKFLAYTYMPIADFPDFDWLAGASSVFLAPQAPDSTCKRVLWRRRRASVRVSVYSGAAGAPVYVYRVLWRRRRASFRLCSEFSL